MLSNLYNEMCDPSNFESITVKVEHPEYGPMESSTNVAQLSNMRFPDPSPPVINMNNYPDPPFRNEIYQKMEQMIGEDSVIDFIESSIDKFLVGLSKDKVPQSEKLRKGAERQRIYRQNETQSQRERRLEMAREYIRKKRDNETFDQRFERLKKQRERIRAIRGALKMNPELYKLRKQIEAERMKVRRANETPLQRMRRLEQSRLYSKRRRNNEVYSITENETDSTDYQYKSPHENFRLQDRQQRDPVRKKIKREMEVERHVLPELSMDHNLLNDPQNEIPGPQPPLPVPIVPCAVINH